MRIHVPQHGRPIRLPSPSGVIRCAAMVVTVAANACAPTPHAESPAKPSPTGRETASSAAQPAKSQAPAPQCELVCEGAALVRHEIPPGESADHYTNDAVDKANETLNAMHDDLLACYTARVKVYPKAHAFLTIDIVVGHDGHVQNVETQGGALLGESTMRCIVDRIEHGEFAPPPHGGTMRFEVPFSLRRVGPDETI